MRLWGIYFIEVLCVGCVGVNHGPFGNVVANKWPAGYDASLSLPNAKTRR